MSVSRRDILLVEDNAADVRLTREAFRENNIQSNLIVVKDGVEAIAYLRRTGPHATSLDAFRKQ